MEKHLTEIHQLKGIKSTNQNLGTSVVVPWLGLSAPSKEGLGSTPGQKTRSYMLKLSPAQTNK